MTTWTTTYTRPLQPITKDAYAVLEAVSHPPTDEELFRTVLSVVAALTDVGEHAIMSKSQWAKLCRPRHIVRYVLANVFGLGPLRTSRVMQCDHSTVTHSVDVVQNELVTDKKMASLVIGVAKALAPHVPRSTPSTELPHDAAQNVEK